MEIVTASDFKARCLAILDRVQKTGERIVISKRGLPVAELGPATKTNEKYPQFDLKNSLTVLGDIVGPAVPEHLWEGLER